MTTALVLGRDTTRSLSPLCHNRAARALGLDLTYTSLSVPTEAAFPGVLAALHATGRVIGANVTIPYKRLARGLARRVTSTADEIGAVNTLVRERDGWLGDNTDGPALVAVIGRLPPATRREVAILGGGGVALSVLWALARLGVDAVSVCVKSPPSPELSALASRVGATIVPSLSAGHRGPPPAARLVVGAVPPEPALAAALDRDLLAAMRPDHVLDLAYGPIGVGTPLVRLARSRGLSAEDGLTLLAEQAALALAGWTGTGAAPILAAMRRALRLPPL